LTLPILSTPRDWPSPCSPPGGPADLPMVSVDMVAGSTSEAYLQENRVSFRQVASVRAGLEAVAAGKQDAMVYDAPLLSYLVNSELHDRVEIVPGTFHRQEQSHRQHRKQQQSIEYVRGLDTTAAR